MLSTSSVYELVHAIIIRVTLYSIVSFNPVAVVIAKRAAGREICIGQ
jgi:hypothetical protein